MGLESKIQVFHERCLTRKTIPGTKPCHPKLPDITDLSMEARIIARATHKQAINEEIKKKQMEEVLDANLPALNAHSHIKMKPYQKTSSAACRTRDMYNHYPIRD